MRVRTDLALEMKEDIDTDEPIKGVHVATKNNGDTDILETRIVVENEEGAMNLGKPVGTYISNLIKTAKRSGKKVPKLMDYLKVFRENESLKMYRIAVRDGRLTLSL